MKNELLTSARQQVGKTQLQVAKEIGIAEAAYRRYELGKCIPNAILANTIARVLGTTSEKIWGYKNSQSL